MITQSVFAAGGCAVAVGDEHGVGAVDAAGTGAGADVVGAGTDVVGAGADAVGAVIAVLGSGAAGVVAAGAAAELSDTPAGAGVDGVDGALLSATAEPLTTAGAAASRDVAVPAGAAAADGAQAPAGVLEALSMSRRCGALKSPIPASSATARSPAIGARRRGFSSKLRYRRASRLRYDRTLRYDIPLAPSGSSLFDPTR
jgi:hypothetical protein